MFLGRDARKRLEPVRVVRGAIRDRPFLHGVGDDVRHLDVERLAFLDGLCQRLVCGGRQQFLHRMIVEHERAVLFGNASHKHDPFPYFADVMKMSSR